MQFKSDTRTLQTTLAQLARLPGAAPADLHSQIITIEAGMEGIRMERFSTVARIVVVIPGEVSSEGSVKVSIAQLQKTMASLSHPETSIGISTLPNKTQFVLIQNGKTNARLNAAVLDSVEPPEPEFETTDIKMPAGALLKILTTVRPGASNDAANKPQTSGVGIRPLMGRTAFLGSNGRVGHFALTDGPYEVDCLIPNDSADCMILALKACSEKSEAVLSIGEFTSRLNCGDSEITCGLAESKMPNVAMVIKPPDEAVLIEVHKEDFLTALKACGDVGDEVHMVEIELGPDIGSVIARNDQGVEITTPIECHCPEPITIKAVSSQLTACIKPMSEDTDGYVAMEYHKVLLLFRDRDLISFSSLMRVEDKK